MSNWGGGLRTYTGNDRHYHLTIHKNFWQSHKTERCLKYCLYKTLPTAGCQQEDLKKERKKKNINLLSNSSKPVSCSSSPFPMKVHRSKAFVESHVTKLFTNRHLNLPTAVATTIIALKKPNSNKNSVSYSYSHRYHNGSVCSCRVSGATMLAASESPSEQQRASAEYELSMKRRAAALQKGIVFETGLVLWWPWLEEGGEGLQVCKVQSFHVCVGGFSAQQREKKKSWGHSFVLFGVMSEEMKHRCISRFCFCEVSPVCEDPSETGRNKVRHTGFSAANSALAVHLEDCHCFGHPLPPPLLLH